jgi:hypothetical protein
MSTYPDFFQVFVFPQINSSKPGPSGEANSSAARQEISLFFWGEKNVQPYIHKSLPIFLTLSEINLLHNSILILEESY